MKFDILEKHIGILLAGISVALSVGAFISIMPLFLFSVTAERFEAIRIYTPLELVGRNIYVREGCHQCHSQMIRTLRHEVDRHGRYSLAVESQYDNPTQWGLRRIGSDLARVGGRHSNAWLQDYLQNPFAFDGSKKGAFQMMPSYAYLTDEVIDSDAVGEDLRASDLGGFYDEAKLLNAEADLLSQAGAVEGQYGLQNRYGRGVKLHNFLEDGKITEMEALIAYLQSVGSLSNLSGN